jgi:hypothetical protein
MKKIILVLGLSVLSACGGGSGNSGNGPNGEGTNPNRIDWDSIPSEYNKSIDDMEFGTEGLEKISINAFGFDRDVEVVYSPKIAVNTGLMRIYRVYYQSTSWGSASVARDQKSISINHYGQYQCSIRTQNGRITGLKGGCYIRLQVQLPTGSEVEVYNVGKLITKRFIPMDTATFLKNLERASFDKDKLIVIDEFLNSYSGMSKKPRLTAKDLGFVIHEIAFKDEKFQALSKLHSFVTDREYLGQMIDEQFNVFDRDDARKICGL